LKNILLTGSGGFIGSHLKKHLNKYNLYTPRSTELNLLEPIAIKEYIKKNHISFIIHSASYGVRITPDATLDEVAKPNIEMFKNLANLNLPMITFGSGAEYDKTKPLINVKEEDFEITIPQDPYGYSKYLISKEIENYNNIINLRIFGIYGSNENETRVTTSIIKNNIAKEPIVLNQNVKFHFIWIEDFCRIVEYFINNQTSKKFINVTPTESIEIKEIANIINQISDFKSEIIIKKSGLNNEYTGDNSLLLKEIGDFEFTDYKTGLKKLYDEIKNKR